MKKTFYLFAMCAMVFVSASCLAGDAEKERLVLAEAPGSPFNGPEDRESPEAGPVVNPGAPLEAESYNAPEEETDELMLMLEALEESRER